MTDQERSELENRISDLISERLGVKKSKIKPESRFVEDLGSDSLDNVELVMDLENAFGILISDEDVATLLTVGDVYSYIAGRVVH